MTKSENGILRFEGTQDKFGARPKDEDGVLAAALMHDCGEVALISTFGSDDSIVSAARVSYGKGTTKKSDARALLRYLLRHKHTSPFEQGDVVFYLKLPLFIAQQLLRHRTAKLNQYSARYSELDSEFYVPNPSHIAPQSVTNKQGRSGTFSDEEIKQIQIEMVDSQQHSFDSYSRLIGMGLARESARVVVPVGTYTQMYWKCDVHNFMHLLKLRMDPHAQKEIVDYATMMYEMVKPFFPITSDAFEDYILNSYNLSALERKMLGDLLRANLPADRSYPANTYGMSEREYGDFKLFLDQTLA